MDVYLDSQRTPTIPSKKSRKASKLRSAPVSFADVPKSPRRPNRHAPVKEPFSGLWEFFYDGEGEEGEEGKGEGEGVERMKNIRGFLFKRRKSPLKGWHKRYFTLQAGILTCARNPVQLSKGKLLSRTDLGLAVITCDSSRWRIDIDEERQVYHLKTKNACHFSAWSACLLAHEMWRKAQLSGTEGLDEGVVGERGGEGEGMEEWIGRTQEVINSLKNDLESVREGLEGMGVYVKSPPPKNNDRGSNSTDSGSEGVGYTQQTSSDSAGGGGGGGSGGGGKERRRWGRKKHDKRNKDTSTSVSLLFSEQQSMSLPTIPVGSLSQSASHSHLDEVMEEHIMRDDFSTTATAVFTHFNEMLEKLEKVQSSFQECIAHERAQKQLSQAVISKQQIMLRQSLVQNAELKNRLAQIQALTAGVDTPHVSAPVPIKTPQPRTPAHTKAFGRSSNSSLPHYSGKTLTRFDSFVSVQSTEFFDALDDVREQSSEEEEEGVTEEHEVTESEGDDDSGEDLFSSFSADVLHSLSLSTGRGRPLLKKPSFQEATLTNGDDSAVTVIHEVSSALEQDEEGGGSRGGGGGGGGGGKQQRRVKLPSPMADMADFSLWSILRKNIGKDLSRISMPVSLNEPLSALQRLCEEVQYSELLDQAAALDDPCDRMVRVAAFAVSAYVTAFHRPARKPFNPILGETFEWIREDKGFRFVAEQVSHHPPMAACHCESPNFTFWQDARIKSKFWGKSMEVFPVGTVNVTIPKHDDHYQWEKVTSCIHNVLGGQRWVDQYGQMTITNRGKCSCKLTFVKASYWSSKKYEVHGDMYNGDGEKVRHLFGTWHEAMYCGPEENPTCMWRAAAMPLDSDQYYGFNQFAIQLNGMEESMTDKLPQSDSRFRPDQRLLEEGFIDEAEQEKHRVEQLQREARAERERVGEEWSPTFFKKESRKGEECWVSRGNYWTHRESGFRDITIPTLW